MDEGSSSHRQWVYEKDPMFYHKLETESEENRPFAAHIVSSDKDILFSEKSDPVSIERAHNVRISNLKSGQSATNSICTPRDPQSSPNAHLKSSASRNRRQNLSNTQTSNKPSAFEQKRQEVLKRKEQLEKDRLDKINSKIKEKEEKFRKMQELREEYKLTNNSFDKRSQSRKRGRYILFITV